MFVEIRGVDDFKEALGYVAKYTATRHLRSFTSYTKTKTLTVS